ncbi:MAG TPA: hypothetical protein VGL09_03620 [Methylomirabilota bacterium]
MRELVFALEFRGHAAAGPDGTRRAKTVAPSQALTTILGAQGVRAEVKALDGGRAILESAVERFPDGTFVEDGTITYGGAGAVTFVTVGRGTVRPAPIAGWTSGVVMWTVTGGAGAFEGATGFITSNFTVSVAGEVIDHHVARLYLT